MFFRKAKTIKCLEEVIKSLKEENEDLSNRLFEMEIKKKRAGRPRKSTSSK